MVILMSDITDMEGGELQVFNQIRDQTKEETLKLADEGIPEEFIET